MGFNLQTKHLKAFQPDVEEDQKKAWSHVKFHYVSQKHEKAEYLNESQKKMPRKHSCDAKTNGNM